MSCPLGIEKNPPLLSGERYMCSILLASFADTKALWRDAVTPTICLVGRSVFLTRSPWGHLASAVA